MALAKVAVQVPGELEGDPDFKVGVEVEIEARVPEEAAVEAIQNSLMPMAAACKVPPTAVLEIMMAKLAQQLSEHGQ